MLKIDKTLLKNLCLINSPSKHESSIVTFIINYCYNIEHIKFEIDDIGNLFIIKNSTSPNLYPCLVAHLDEVHKLKTPRRILFKDNLI